MIRGFYSARTGVMAQQQHLNVVANNLANVNTVGFKDSRASFADLMYQNINRPTAENAAMVGHGVKLNKTDLSMAQGALDPSDSRLDYALTGEGTFFGARKATGEIYYTRAGNFILSRDEDDVYYLAAPNGDRILDPDGEDIEILFDEDGKFELNKAEIGVFTFSNPYGLNEMGGNRFTATDVSGEATVVEQPGLMAGYLEKSSVAVAEQMVKMIEASKAFSFNSKMIITADEVQQTINGLR